MELTRNGFRALSRCAEQDISSVEDLARLAGLEPQDAESALASLRRDGLLEGFRPTADGIAALEPYRVDNAVIMAAGFASRFAPISYDTPKGLLNVKGEVLVERQIRQLREAGIEDVTVVVGYRKEKFFYLRDLLDVEIIVNDEYNERNNHSSLWIAREKLGNTYVCSSDNYFPENPFHRYEYRAFVPGLMVPEEVTEWAMETDGDGRITSYGEKTGSNLCVALGHVFFDRAFSEGFLRIVEDEWDLPETKSKLWDTLFAEHVDDLAMYVEMFPYGSILEFDSLDDLRKFDPDFIENVDSEILDNICEVLGCARTSIHDIKPVKEGLTNLSFRFKADGGDYIYRHPGEGSDLLVDRESETDAERVAFDLGLDRTFIYEHPSEGWKISRFVTVCDTFDYENLDHVRTLMRMVRAFHDANATAPRRFDAYEESVKLADAMYGGFEGYPEATKELFRMAQQLAPALEADGVEACLVHGDAWGNNVLISEDGFDLVDWEYAAMGDYGLDIGSFVQHYQSDASIDYSIDQYFGGKASPEEYRHSIAMIGMSKLYWSTWATYERFIGRPIGEDEFSWFEFCGRMLRKGLELYDL